MSSDSFSLHPQLAADTLPVGDLPLCRVLLMNRAAFPWLVLVPRRPGKRELFELEPLDYKMATDELRMVSEVFSRHTAAEKMNIAALGNMVPQLHIHVIARFATDAAWPNPIWGTAAASTPYSASEANRMQAEIKALLGL